MIKKCHDCRFFEWDEEYSSDGHYGGWWFACTARRGVANLKQFPFKDTACPKYKAKGAASND